MVSGKKTVNVEFIGFTILSGMIYFSNNVVMTIIPLRMADGGLSYGMIGTVMSAVAVGLLVIKILTGYLSDLVGTKRFILLALAGLAGSSFLLAWAEGVFMYSVLMAALGIFRGIFQAVSGAYVLEMSEEGSYGRFYGTVESVTSFLASVGGMISGLLYRFQEGKYALYICSILLAAGFLWTFKGLKDNHKIDRQAISLTKIFCSMNKRIVIFCVLIFIQSFVAGPMWNFIIPMYCYNVMRFSPAKVGFLMSLDELVSAPTYMVAGNVVDKVNILRFNILFLLTTALSGFLMAKTTSWIGFMGIFLICSVSISCTFIGIPKQRVVYVQKERKGFELALISLWGSIGDALGSNILGKVAEKYGITLCIYIFVAAYVIMAVLVMIPVIYGKNGMIKI